MQAYSLIVHGSLIILLIPWSLNGAEEDIKTNVRSTPSEDEGQLSKGATETTTTKPADATTGTNTQVGLSEKVGGSKDETIVNESPMLTSETLSSPKDSTEGTLNGSSTAETEATQSTWRGMAYDKAKAAVTIVAKAASEHLTIENAKKALANEDVQKTVIAGVASVVKSNPIGTLAMTILPYAVKKFNTPATQVESAQVDKQVETAQVGGNIADTTKDKKVEAAQEDKKVGEIQEDKKVGEIQEDKKVGETQEDKKATKEQVDATKEEKMKVDEAQGEKKQGK